MITLNVLSVSSYPHRQESNQKPSLRQTRERRILYIADKRTPLKGGKKHFISVTDIYRSFSKASETRLRDQIAGLEETTVFLNKNLAVILLSVPQAAK